MRLKSIHEIIINKQTCIWSHNACAANYSCQEVIQNSTYKNTTEMGICFIFYVHVQILN